MKTHRFQPAEYHLTLGSHVPVLEIEDGDTVLTTTVDNKGRDASDRQVTSPGNPQTGPFYIRGADAGDTLAVRFDRITPTRSIGRTRTCIAPRLLDPEYAAAVWHGGREEELLEWRIDTESWTATLLAPSFPAGRLSLPLDPMVGCFGTAPPRGQLIASNTASRYGGNMDYRGFTAGATVYLPVFVKGGLFHLGDVHALQGDGEIVGTGIEVSAEVEFTVRLIKGRRIDWPRAETRDSILSAANARPLVQAFQEATTEMVRWLVELGLEETRAHVLLGQCVRYEVGNVYDPAYTMICKVGKSLLQGIGLEGPWL
ncbi:MAG: acetamidase/formamidase family protein [Spirochaetaceae bacterium]|nr:MAG: acetamidase/formamidase family protein [Spirochaetaceae bacterium]